MRTCPTCNGFQCLQSERRVNAIRCPSCDGLGQVTSDHLRALVYFRRGARCVHTPVSSVADVRWWNYGRASGRYARLALRPDPPRFDADIVSMVSRFLEAA